MAEFEQLIVQLMSADNAVRGQAERAFNDGVKQAPDTLTMALIQAIRTSQNQPVITPFTPSIGSNPLN